MKRESVITPTAVVSVSLLGGFGLEMGGTVLTDEINRSQKLWNVLSYLIVHRDRSVPQSEFIDVFWPDDDSANPANALKTLLYRIRTMLEEVFGNEVQPILSQRGSYSWNRAIVCKVDTNRFELLCRKAESELTPRSDRIMLYREALTLYKGDFLPKLSSELWVVPISTHYHGLYLAAVKDMARLLDESGEYAEMAEICTRASQLDQLDEDIHVLLVRALLHQGKNVAALSHYEQATELLYRNLGVKPSAELRALYTAIMSMEQGLETDLEVIQEDLRETAGRPGAFVCEYGFFRETYRLEARRAKRSGTCVHVALITVSLPDGGVPPLNVLNTTMDHLIQELIGGLRRGDVVSRYSGAQYVVLLPSANFEDSNMVMDRIIGSFYHQHRRNFLKLSWKVRELELD